MVAVDSSEIVAVGRRKTSTAFVALTPGTGKVVINEREFEEYLKQPTLRVHALEPLAATGQDGRFDVRVRVTGGGPSGQAGAIRLALARALAKHSSEMRPTLREKGMLTRDPRMKERKKYGQRGARRRFQFSKR
ncbi:MAG: 30S ribosomal protein S9 [Verrucomicrobiae bacterium]|nr:30S ribosomal protein S9 [Verrucomicrobiae bacterium]MDW8343758.1 30S ribosomal protein S9 [Verrucomicrobiae bacterium]